MANLNKLKIPVTNNNMVLSTDENGKITDSNIKVQDLTSASKIKFYFIPKEWFAEDDHPALTEGKSEYFVEIYKNYINGVPMNIYTQIADINDGTSNYLIPCALYTKPSWMYMYLYCVDKINGMKISDTSTNGNFQLSQTTQGLHISFDSNSEPSTTTGISYAETLSPYSNTSILHYLSTQDSTSDEEVTWLPTKAGQPANKKYVDQQIANIQSQINSIELTVDDILGQPESTETQN